MKIAETNSKIKQFKHLDADTKNAIFEVIDLKTSDDMKEVIQVLNLFKTEIKSEIGMIRTEAEAFRSEIKAEIRTISSETNSLRIEMKAENAAIRSEMKAETAVLKTEIAKSRNAMIIWTISTILALFSVTIAIIKIH